eukprot:scaffold2909_cov78-Cylindrotheca_fusiformis.AAC.5
MKGAAVEGIECGIHLLFDNDKNNVCHGKEGTVFDSCNGMTKEKALHTFHKRINCFSGWTSTLSFRLVRTKVIDRILYQANRTECGVKRQPIKYVIVAVMVLVY